MMGLHVTDTKNVDSIIEKGFTCKKYPEHPTAKDLGCTTFFYPIDGVDEDLKYWPQNARMRGVELDDASYIVADIDNSCIVGDLMDEGEPEKYKAKSMSSKNYLKELNYSRYRFEEPEMVCPGNTPPEKILGSLLYSEMDEINNKCMESRNKYECMETGIRKKLNM